MTKIGSHIHPKCYLERWKIPNHLSQGQKKMVYVFPYNKYEAIKKLSIDNDFFKKYNYYARLSNNGDLINDIETILSGSYESTLQELLDDCLNQIGLGIFSETHEIHFSQKLIEDIFKFLTYTFFRCGAGEVYGLTIESILQQGNAKEMSEMKIGKFHFNGDENIIEESDNILVSKLAYNKNYIGNKKMIEYISNIFRKMNLTFLYSEGDLNYITNNEVFTLFERGETMQKTTFIIPLDPKLCVLLGGEIDGTNLKVFLNDDEQVKKINWTLLWNQVINKPHKFIISNQLSEIKRLISDNKIIVT